MSLVSTIENVKEWQTLVSAIIALIAALFTIITMNRQMGKDEARHELSAVRKRKAVRAQLPDALSELAAHIVEMNARIIEGVSPEAEPPVTALSTLKVAIEFIDDSAAERTFQLVSWYQVWSARLRRYDPKNDMETALYDGALLMSYVNSLFDYSRNETDEVEVGKVSGRDMEAALKNSIEIVNYYKNEAIFFGVSERIARNHPVE